MGPSLPQALHAMACNNAWANLRLHRAVAGLDAGAFGAPRTGFFPSLRATLNHILVVDRFYVDALEGGTLGPVAWADSEPHAEIGPLAAEQAALDRRLVAHCAALDDARLGETVDVHRGAAIQRERRDRLLLHLFQHQVHHRGQAHAMLSGTTVRPPQLDEFFSVGEASLRADEFAELGLSEAAIWGAEAR